MLSLAHRPHLSPVPFSDPARCGEADSASRVLILAMEAMEWIEYGGCVLRVEAYPIVSHEVRQTPIRLHPHHVELSNRAVGSEFPSISYEVFEERPQQGLVGVDD